MSPRPFRQPARALFVIPSVHALVALLISVALPCRADALMRPSTTAPPAPPVAPQIPPGTPVGSDSCASAPMLPGKGLYYFDTTNATTGSQGQANPLCNSFGTSAIDKDIWFVVPVTLVDPPAWAPTAAMITTCGLTDGDTRIASYWTTQGCPTTVASACNDDACSYQSRVCIYDNYSGPASAPPPVPTILFATVQLGNYPGSTPAKGWFLYSGTDCEGVPPAAPSLTLQPQSLAKCSGSSASLTVQTSSFGPLYYQWFKNSVPLPGQTAATLSFASLLSGDTASYAVLVANAAGMVMSDSASITVSTPPNVPLLASASTCAGSCHTFSANATGSNLTYQWFRNGQGINGATSSTYCATSAGAYRVDVASGACAKSSNDATLTVNAAPSFTQQPLGASVCELGAYTLTVATVPSSGVSYRWLKDGAFVGTAPSYQIQNATSASAGKYKVEVTINATLCKATSNEVTVTVTPLPVLPTLADAAVCSGACHTFQANATGTGLSYAWYFDGNAISGASSASYCAEQEGKYKVQVTSNGCSRTSNEAKLTIHSPPSFDLQPVGGTFCAGAAHTLIVATTPNAGVDYQWYKDGAPQVGATQPSLTLASLSDATVGNYACTATVHATGCALTSQAASVSLKADTESAYWASASGGDFLDPSNWSTGCVPYQYAGLSDSVAPGDSNLAWLGAGQHWTVEQLQISAVDTSVQTLELRCASSLAVSSLLGASVLANGRLLLSGGTLVGRVAIEPKGTLEGVGRIDGAIAENAGLLRATGASGCTSRELEVGGAELVNLSGGKIEVAAATGVLRAVGAVLRNDGAVEVKVGGALHAQRIENRGSGVEGITQSNGSIVVPLAEDANPAVVSPAEMTIVNGDGTVAKKGVWKATGSIAGRIWNTPFSALIVPAPLAGTAPGTLTLENCVQNDGWLSIGSSQTLRVLGAGCAPAFSSSSKLQGSGSCVLADGSPCPTTAASIASGPVLDVDGDVELAASASVHFDGGTLRVEGDFVCDIATMFELSLSNARVELDGAAAASAQHLWMHAPDLGAIGDFDAPAAMAIGELVIGPNRGAHVRFAHPSASGPATLYVRRLEVGSGSVLELDDALVYADELVLAPSSTLVLDTGTLHAREMSPADPCGAGLVVGACSAQLVAMPAPDCDGNGIADVLDIASGAAIDCNQNSVPDACDLAYGTSLDQDLDGELDVCEAFSAHRPSVSAAGGDVYEMSLHAGPAQAGRMYVIAGTASGTQPGIALGGVHVPLNVDAYTLLTLGAANKAPYAHTLGALDASGRAQASITIEPGTLPPELIGVEFHYAFATLDPALSLSLASNPIALQIVP